MLSPRLITFVALIAVGVAYPPIRKSFVKRPETSLNRAELEDNSPWIKFPFFGNILESFPNFLPTIPEAGPKIENDSHKFQVIINVKGYKKEFIKVKEKGSFIIIQGAHEDLQDKNSIDSQFIHTYTLPPKASAASVSATLTSDGYLVVTAPIGSVINKPTNIEKEIAVIELGEPLNPPKPENNVSSTTTSATIIQTPAKVLLPPNPIIIDEALSTDSLIPAVPSVSLLPPKPIKDDFVNVESSIPIVPSIELLPPKPNSDETVNETPVNQVPEVNQVGIQEEEVSTEDQISLLSPTTSEKPKNEVFDVPNIISIPLQQQDEGHQIVIAPTYASEVLNKSENNQNVESEEKISTPSNEIIENTSNVSEQLEGDKQTTVPIMLFQEPIKGFVTVNSQEPAGNTIENSNDGIYSATVSLPKPTTIVNFIKEKATTAQPEEYSIPDLSTEVSPSMQQHKVNVDITSVLRSEFSQEQDGITGEPETLIADEHNNEEGSGQVQLSSQISLEATTSIVNVIETTTSVPILLQKDDVNELIVEYSPRSFGEENKNDEINYITTEPSRLEDRNVIIGRDNAIEDSTLSDNIQLIDQPEKVTSFESLSNIAVVSYNNDPVPSAPKTEESTEQVTLPGSETYTSEVTAF